MCNTTAKETPGSRHCLRASEARRRLRPGGGQQASRRLILARHKWADTGTACGIDIETGAQEFEWTDPGGLIVFFHRRCAEIYRTLNDGHEGG